MRQVGTNEGQRALRNAASFGTFLLSPLHMAVLSRALGQAGFGRWWTSFVVLEAAQVLGMTGIELFVRRELPRAQDDNARHAIVGSALAVMLVTGVVLLGLQLALARTIAESQHDPDLVPFLVVLAIQPILWNVTNVLAASLQSSDVWGPVAVLRGLAMPLALSGVLAAAWQLELATETTLILLALHALVALIAMALLFTRHFSLRRTLASIASHAVARRIVRFGFGLLPSTVLIVVLGKLDLYILGIHVSPIEVGIYGACLQMAAMLPNTRGIFDPIAQAKVGELHGTDPGELAHSLQRLSRMCALAMMPSFVMIVAVGQPVMEALLGHSIANALVPLAILCAGQLLANIAMAAWLVPMTMKGRVLTTICAITLAVKLALLVTLIPQLGLAGAAIATAMGTIVPMHLQGWLGARALRRRVYTAGIIPAFLASAALAVGGRALYVARVEVAGPASAAAVAGGAALLGLCIALPLLLTADERRALRRRIIGPRDV